MHIILYLDNFLLHSFPVLFTEPNIACVLFNLPKPDEVPKCERQIHNSHLQLFKYSIIIPILRKFSQRVHTSLKTY